MFSLRNKKDINSFWMKKVPYLLLCILLQYQSICLTRGAKLALYRSPDYQTSHESIGLFVQEKKFNIDFQDGRHLGYPIRMILATFELQVTSILPMKFQVNLGFPIRMNLGFFNICKLPR